MSYPQRLFAAYGFVAAKPHAVSAISAVFLHAGIIFLLPNMIFLSVLGQQLEDAFGRLRFVGVFLLSGIAGTAVFYLLDRSSTNSMYRIGWSCCRSGWSILDNVPRFHL
jgi:membrane associated rhomboid family serine protease